MRLRWKVKALKICLASFSPENLSRTEKAKSIVFIFKPSDISTTSDAFQEGTVNFFRQIILRNFFSSLSQLFGSCFCIFSSSFFRLFANKSLLPMNHFNWIIQLDVVLYQFVYFTLPITQQLLKRGKKREKLFQNSFFSSVANSRN